MLDIQQNRRTRKYSFGEMTRRVEAISAPLLWSEDRPQCSRLSFGDDLFSMELGSRR